METRRLRPPGPRRGRADWTTLLVLALGGAAILWVLLGDRGETGPATGRAAARAANPCLEPVAWRLGDVDPRFGIPRARVLDSVHAAVRLWEEAAGRRLFVHDEERGMPIRFVFDDRQAETMAALDGADRLRELEERVHRERAGYDAMHREFLELREAYDQGAAALRVRADEHERAVRDAQARGRVPDDERARLNAEAEAIRREARELERIGRRLDELGPRLEDEARRLQRLVDGYNREVRAYREDSPGRRIRSAVFEEVTLSGRGRRAGTERRITIYQFTDEPHLTLLLAHELGHALGLDHVNDPLAVMREEYALEPGGAVLRLRPADLEALRERCGADAWGGAP